MSVDELQQRIMALPPDDRNALLRWLDAWYEEKWNAWDRQIETDGKAGRLDHLIAKIEADIAAGRTKPLP